MNLKENTNYRLRNGWVVGNLVCRDGGEYGDYFEVVIGSPYHPQFDIPFPMWKSDGRWDAFHEFEVPYANDPAFDIVEEL